MAITAAQVKELRQRTGSGMMECKKALVEADGDVDTAIESLRKTGLAKADKKAGRVAAEGLIVMKKSDDGKGAVIVEVNSETDFVAKKEEFQTFANKVAEKALAALTDDVAALMSADGDDLENDRKELIAKLGENINVRRFARISSSANIADYLHGVRIGVLAEVEGGDEDLARDVAMHIAASNPAFISEKDVDPAVLDKEKAILVAQAAESGKPDNIIEKMVEGRIKKFLAEITLLGQPFVKDPDVTVGQLLEKAGATMLAFNRIELGEGIEKKEENFAEEVMAQVRGE
ncbi:MAG: elongation factor Ts [Gammaproteobacteria bacterium]|nr:elongation factor Ts [Gammaproteobacteria bacterium]